VTTRLLVALLLVLVTAAPTVADEPNPFRWPTHRQLADRLSDVLVGVQIAAEFREAWREDDRSRALRCWGLKNAIGYGVNEGVKRLIKRNRPDGSDAKSFWSMHSMGAAQNGGEGWRLALTVNVGLLRMGADKHFPSDVAVGFGAGWLTSKICP